MALFESYVLYGGLALVGSVTGLVSYVFTQQAKRIDRLESKIEEKPNKATVIDLINDKLEPLNVYIFDIKEDIHEMKQDLKEALKK